MGISSVPFAILIWKTLLSLDADTDFVIDVFLPGYSTYWLLLKVFSFRWGFWPKKFEILLSHSVLDFKSKADILTSSSQMLNLKFSSQVWDFNLIESEIPIYIIIHKQNQIKNNSTW